MMPRSLTISVLPFKNHFDTKNPNCLQGDGDSYHLSKSREQDAETFDSVLSKVTVKPKGIWLFAVNLNHAIEPDWPHMKIDLDDCPLPRDSKIFLAAKMVDWLESWNP